MNPTILFVVLLSLSSLGYYLGRRRAFAAAAGLSGISRLHSRPTYYGALTALWCGIPAVLIFGFWLAFEDSVITHLVVAELPEKLRGLSPDRLNGRSGLL